MGHPDASYANAKCRQTNKDGGEMYVDCKVFYLQQQISSGLASGTSIVA